MSDSTSPIPIVDFASFAASSNPTARLETAKALTNACRDVGFVYITNHGMPAERVAEAFSWSGKLFALSKEDKMRAPHPPGAAVHRGYSWPGLEKVSDVIAEEVGKGDVEKLRDVPDFKESYEIGSEEYAEQPNVWLPPEVLPGFQEFMTEFYWECERITRALLKALALGVGLSDEEYLVKYHTGHENQLRLLHYPPIAAENLERRLVTRMPGHTDWGSLTILFQDDCGGLEIEDPNEKGKFMFAAPVKDTLVMNVGDLLQRWSNDSLKSTMHRVGLPQTQSSFAGHNRITQSRYSIPYFVGPVSDTVIECLPACVDAEHPAKHEPITWNDYRIMRGKAHYAEPAAAIATIPQ